MTASRRQKPKQMDYGAWARRAKKFIRSLYYLPGSVSLSDSIEPSHREDRIAWRVESFKEDRSAFDRTIREFMRTASIRCNFGYEWEPPRAYTAELRAIFPGATNLQGGGDLCEAAYYGMLDFTGYDNEFCRDEDERPNWIRLMKTADGEIALESEKQKKPPRVFYITKDAATVLTNGFDQFLQAWEAICYVRPDWDVLQRWIDPKTKRLDPNHDLTDRLRKLLSHRITM